MAIPAESGVVTVAHQTTNRTVGGDAGGSSAVLAPYPEATRAAVAALFTSISIVGYKRAAFRSNVNRRDVGVMATSERMREIHVIPLGAPQTVRTQY